MPDFLTRRNGMPYRHIIVPAYDLADEMRSKTRRAKSVSDVGIEESSNGRRLH
jgi:hypothetical protein